MSCCRPRPDFETAVRSEPKFPAGYSPCYRVPGSAQVRLLGLEAASDEQIWAYAAAHDFVIVTKDEDFANRAALIGPYQVSLAVLQRHLVALKHFVAEGTGACIELYP